MNSTTREPPVGTQKPSRIYDELRRIEVISNSRPTNKRSSNTGQSITRLGEIPKSKDPPLSSLHIETDIGAEVPFTNDHTVRLIPLDPIVPSHVG